MAKKVTKAMATPKDYTILKQIPACHVYTFEYLSNREMTEDEEERIIDVMSEYGYGRVLFAKAITNSFDEACNILRVKANAAKK